MKNIVTIGDFAKLNESDISEFFIKPPNRLERSRAMLRKYYMPTSYKTTNKFLPEKIIKQSTPEIIDVNEETVLFF